jgi:PsbN protein
MEPTLMDTSATSLAVTFAAIIVSMTAYAVYTAFGPPSKQLTDPFDDHED